MSITFVQTSDPFRYYPMLQETARTVRQYCLKNGFRYEQYVGVKRGHMLWQATFNRIYMLKEMLDRGVEGWVFYIDADSMIVDMTFDVVDYLADKGRYGGIFAGYLSERYDINAGGFAVNLSHPAGRALVEEYHRRGEALSGEDYHKALSWDHDVLDDQAILYGILKDWDAQPDYADAFLFEPVDNSHVNTGPFIGQELRSLHPSPQARMDAIRRRVRTILASVPPYSAGRVAGLYLEAAHPRLVTACGKKTDAGIVTTGKAGAFLRGPRARIAPGDHIIRVFGRADGSVPASTVVAEGGDRILSAAPSSPASTLDVLTEHRVVAPEGISDLEVRMDVGETDRLCIHAVQIVADREGDGLTSCESTIEGDGSHPTLSDVSRAYQLFLGREVESAAVAGYHLSGGHNLWSLIEAICNSEEAKRLRFAETIDEIRALHELSFRSPS